MGYRLDEIDKRIIYHLMKDARNTSAPQIADDVSVSAGTIRNRINQMQEHGILIGFHANVDFERSEGYLTNLFTCTAEIVHREEIIQRIFAISGVINVRELMTGRGNVQIKAIGKDTNDLARIARELTNIGIEIEDEGLIRNERFQPYQKYGPDKERSQLSMTDLISLSGESDVVETVISADAPIANKTLKEADQAGLIGDELLIIAIERDDSILTPKGSTRIQPNDVVTVFSRKGVSDQSLQGFTEQAPG
ncbi:Lrp/AsnC family transcriptional regulator [Haladaptatus halobius]|uniref:Lrp/AsnC family transcriptional regulator n=1 Tax=Haladaptatus halobius TaxID=2884875 RepID=UPI001D0BCBDF|nr:Lrp/AsnC family transcriptional regulator [Haladaptatus halobius]